MSQPTPQELAPAEQYLMNADLNKLRCVDERLAEETVINDGIAIPGGIYGIIDTIKAINRVDEDKAWEQAKQAGIPMDAHVDTHHHERGCGYGKLVEDEPATVGAIESVPAATRKHAVDQHGGTVLTLLGDHCPTEAILNFRNGTTIDTKKAVGDKRGIFNCDVWALPMLAEKLHMNPDQFTQHVIAVYKKTVTKLTGMTTFVEVR